MATNLFKSINFGYAKDNILRDAARISAAESLKFFKESFRNEGFTDASLTKWLSRKSPLGGKRLMYGKGTLMKSIRVTEENTKRVVVTSNTPYSALHNDGGTVKVTAQMKKYWWAQYYKLSGSVSSTKSGKESKSKRNKKLRSKAEYCKTMAMMKVGTEIKIPQRKFIGESKTLMNELDRQFQIKIDEYWEKM
jgi:phage gpG-like protein